MERNGEYFHFFVKRGLARMELGEKDAAYRDLETSVKLLPTATALNSLGDLSQARGEMEKAKEFYAAAAESSSPPGQEAARSLVRIDLPGNPNRYLSVRLGLDSSRYLLAEINNPTALPVADVDLLIQFVDSRGLARQLTLQTPGTIAPGTSVRVATGIGPVENAASFKDLRAGVVGARIVE